MPGRRLRNQCRFAAVLLAGFLLAQMPAYCSGATESPRPNVLVLVSDDQRPDTIAALGNSVIRTPHLDALVRRGTAFPRATCANPICTPSRAEILTGASGFTNGVLDFGKKVSPTCAAWGKTMRQAGYRTFYVGKWHNSGRPSDYGYTECVGLYSGGGGRSAKPQVDYFGRPVTGYRGWIFQTNDRKLFPERGVGLTPDISADFADAAISIIERDADEPFFVHVNFTAPHDPLLIPTGYEDAYDAESIPVPPNFVPEHPFDHGNFDGRDEKLFKWPRTHDEVRSELAAYYAVISHLDAQVGRIVKALGDTGQLDNTIVVYTSDHGLGMGSHGIRGKQNMYEHTIGIPMVMAGPGVPRDVRAKTQCYLRDLFPTVCDLAGVTIPAAVEGRSLKPALDDPATQLYREIFGYFRDKQRMIRTERWKLVRYPHIDHWQLFDLENDPHEIKNVADDREHATTFVRLRSLLEKWQMSVNDPVLVGPAGGSAADR